jgi:aldose 1-epimerase
MDSIPKGTVEPVAGTPMDFTVPHTIGSRIRAIFPQLLYARGYDHNYVIDGPMGLLRPMARAVSEQTGIVMEAETTLPGVHFYTGNFLPKGDSGKGGHILNAHHGFCLEAQFFPDSPNRPEFPSPILKAGEEYTHSTLFRFRHC